MPFKRESVGKTPDGHVVDRYTLVNENGLRVAIFTYGATITTVEVPDRNGQMENVVLSLDSLQDYFRGHPYFGSTVGRYANRIAKGTFRLLGKEYKLATNDGPNHLHGGRRGFDKAVWNAETFEGPDAVSAIFTHDSPDGDEGYPGKLATKATYSLTNTNKLLIELAAITDAPTIVNLTNHAYWNLAGASRDVLEHELMLNADGYLPVDTDLIPLGEIRKVEGTPMDFTRPHTIGSRIAQVEGGYDHCYVINRDEGEKTPILAARVVDPASGRAMEMYTSQPGVQFYSGNFLDGTLHRGKTPLAKHFGFCLETQHFPNSPNHSSFPTTRLMPGEVYRHTTIHRFYVA